MQADPYELNPLNIADHQNLAARLNAILLATKSCAQDSCRDPWKTLHPDGKVRNLAGALDSTYDAYYGSMPRVAIKECLAYQLPSNEVPFFPGFDADAADAFGQAYRNSTEALGSSGFIRVDSVHEAIPETGNYGAVYQNLSVVELSARPLTDEELSSSGLKRRQIRFPGYAGWWT